MLFAKLVICTNLTILQVVEPTLTHVIEPPIELAVSTQLDFTTIKASLVQKFGKIAEDELACLDCFNFATIRFTPDGQKAYQATCQIYQELLAGNYSQEAAQTYLHWATRLFVNHLSGGARIQATEVEKFKQEFLHPETFDFVERSVDETGHSNAWDVLRKKNRERFAILKESAEVTLDTELKIDRVHPLCFSSFLKLLPEMPLTTKVNDFERIGFELDALFGFDRVPITLTVRFIAEDGKEHEGSLQLYVQDSQTGSQATKLATLDKSKAHLTAISSIFKGVMAGHQDNYLLRVSGDKVIDAIEIDLEEIMPPFNRVPSTITPSVARALVLQKSELLQKIQTPEVSAQITEIDHRIDTIRKSIVLGRMWILGLPQAKKPLDRALLMTICHPSMRAIFESYNRLHLKQGLLPPSTLEALRERLDILQSISTEELAKPLPTATARDVYFAVFGGRELYNIAKSKGYPDLVAFNNVVSDPYQHVLKDFSKPEEMASCCF